MKIDSFMSSTWRMFIRSGQQIMTKYSMTLGWPRNVASRILAMWTSAPLAVKTFQRSKAQHITIAQLLEKIISEETFKPSDR